MFFEQISIEGEPFIDGGMGRNNPINQVLEEAKLMFPGRHIDCIVSLGTGQAKTIQIPGKRERSLSHEVIKAMKNMAIDCEASAQDATRHFEHTPGVYRRFNVDQGMQDVGLEQWEKLDEVRSHTEQYMRMAEVNPTLKAAVAALYRSQMVEVDTEEDPIT